MKPIRKVILILILVGFLIFIFTLLINLKQENSDKDNSEFNFEVKLNPQKLISTTKTQTSKILIPHQNDNNEIWRAWLEKQAEQIGQLTESPDKTQSLLKEAAIAIPKNKIEWLQKIAKNNRINVDQRLLAIEFISLNPNVDTLDALEDIALSPINDELGASLKNEAIALKASAIEGFALKENYKKLSLNKLNNIANKTDNKFLLDRTQRTIWYLKGAAEKPEIQDTKALKKLLDI
jgi:hypothetical protein